MDDNMILYADRLASGNGGKALARNINFRISRGECVFLCGANGTGKSTLMRTLAGLIPPVDGKTGPDSTRTVLIPARIPKVEGFTAAEFIAAGCYRDSDWLGRISARRRSGIMGVMEDVGIRHLAEKDISELSDGEFQKAAIAAAMMQEADVIMLDEPTAFLDVDSRDSVLSCLKSLAGRGRVSVIFSSHDIAVASGHCSRMFGLAENTEAAESEGRTYFLDSGPDASADAMDAILAKCFRTYGLRKEEIDRF